MSQLRPFHLAIPVHKIDSARYFYGQVLGFSEGRSSEQWIDFNCYGHQLVTHLDPSMKPRQESSSNQVDGHSVPVPHFGVVLEMDDWKALVERLEQQQIKFIIEPYIRFAGQEGEQATFFCYDPSGNALEFKAMDDLTQLFEK